jgi:ABC-type dipeptide/oligopeptide/nickel transport system permease component
MKRKTNIHFQKRQNKMLKVVIRNIIYMILLSIVALFLGLVLSFIFTRLLPGDPVLAYLPERFTQEEYLAMLRQLGLDQPIIIQFFRHVSDFFTGNLGLSGSINRGQPLIELLTNRIPASIEFTILPIVSGLFAGILLGILSVKVRYRLIKLLIQILTISVISMPIFVVGIWSQYTFAFQMGIFPALGDPSLPSGILFLLTLFLTARQVRSNYLKKSEEKHILSNSLQIIFNISILIASIFLLEVTFGIHGFFDLFIISINLSEYWLFRACLFIIIALTVFVLFLSNIVYTIYNYFSEERQSKIFTTYIGRNEQVVEESARYGLNSDQSFKDFTIYRLKSPLTIIGLAIVVFTIIVAIFPQVLTPFSMQEALAPGPGAWDPPSATHPLGQTAFGRDVLALLAYGVSTSITVCILPVLIGIAIGLNFGYLSKVHRWVKGVVLGVMVILFIIPSVIVIVIIQGNYFLGGNITMIMSIMTLYMIPLVTLLISRGNYSYKLTAKKLIAYFPLFMAINIMLFEAIGFLGFSDPLIIQLGDSIKLARSFVYFAPWASLWPGLALYVLMMGFFTLHYGLKEPIPIVGRL